MEFEKNFLYSCGSGYGCSGACEDKETCCEEILETQRVILKATDVNGVVTETTHTAISEAIETNNKLDEVIVDVDGVKKVRVDANVEVDTTGLATEAKQQEIIDAINNKVVSVDLSSTNQILTDIKNQEQSNSTALLNVASEIKTLVENQPNKTDLTTEVDRIVAAVQAGGSQIDYTQQLSDILAKLVEIDTNTDKDYTSLLNSLQTTLDNILVKVELLVGQYNQALADLKTELQAISTNTDTVEEKLQLLIDKQGYDDAALKQLITDLSVMLNEEHNETQELLKVVSCDGSVTVYPSFQGTATSIGVISNISGTISLKNIRLGETYTVDLDGNVNNTAFAQGVTSDQEFTDTYEVSYNGITKVVEPYVETCLDEKEKSIAQIADEISKKVTESVRRDENVKVEGVQTDIPFSQAFSSRADGAVVTDLMLTNTGTANVIVKQNGDVVYTLVPGQVKVMSGMRDYSTQIFSIEDGGILEMNFAGRGI